MKFTHAWADVASQNSVLKLVTVCLAICVICLGVAAAKLGTKKSIVVERGCFTKTLSQGDAQRTSIEIEAFLKEALSQRFDSNSGMTRGFFDASEENSRAKEQKEFSTSGMTQRIVVNAMKISNGQVQVDADRLISVGSIRSAFPFPLVVNIANDARTENNPYGMMITKIVQPKEEDRNAKK